MAAMTSQYMRGDIYDINLGQRREPYWANALAQARMPAVTHRPVHADLVYFVCFFALAL